MNVYLWKWMSEWIRPSLSQMPLPEDSARARSRSTEAGQNVRGSHARYDSRFPSELTLCGGNSSNEGFLSSETNHLFTQNHKMSFLFRRKPTQTGSRRQPPNTTPQLHFSRRELFPGTFHSITSDQLFPLACASSSGVYSIFLYFCFQRSKTS